jgi:NADPH2:quinone reductase
MSITVEIEKVGGPEVLRLVDLPPTEPKTGEVWLRQQAIGVNFLDVKHRNGGVQIPLPGGLGVEAAGVVEALGPGVIEISKGDRVVYALGPIGSYAQGRIYPADRLIKLPDDILSEDAAATFLKGLTAHYLLTDTFPVREGTHVLMYGAGGGLGQIMVPWARALGAQVIGVVSRASSASRASAAGCDDVLVWGDGDLASTVKDLTSGRGVDVVYDGVGRETFDASLSSLRPRGMMVSMGASSGLPDPVSMSRLNKASLFLTRPGLADHIADKSEYQRRASAVFEALRRGVIKPSVWRSFPLKDVSVTHHALESGAAQGTILLIP